MRATWISWRHQSSDFTHPLTYDEKVDVFYEQTLGWQLHIADLLANGGSAFPEGGLGATHPVRSVPHGGFAVLHICFSYFELVGSIVSAETGYSLAPHGAWCNRADPKELREPKYKPD